MSKTSSTVKDRYNKKTYDDIRLRVKKGMKDDIQTHAEKQGLSLNGYINLILERDMKQWDGLKD